MPSPPAPPRRAQLGSDRWCTSEFGLYAGRAFADLNIIAGTFSEGTLFALVLANYLGSDVVNTLVTSLASRVVLGSTLRIVATLSSASPPARPAATPCSSCASTWTLLHRLLHQHVPPTAALLPERLPFDPTQAVPRGVSVSRIVGCTGRWSTARPAARAPVRAAAILGVIFGIVFDAASGAAACPRRPCRRSYTPWTTTRRVPEAHLDDELIQMGGT